MPKGEKEAILTHCHSREAGGHFVTSRTTSNVLQSEFCWPILLKNAHSFFKHCDQCKGNVSNQNEFTLNNILVSKIFDIWEVDFIGSFPSLYEIK